MSCEVYTCTYYITIEDGPSNYILWLLVSTELLLYDEQSKLFKKPLLTASSLPAQLYMNNADEKL